MTNPKRLNEPERSIAPIMITQTAARTIRSPCTHFGASRQVVAASLRRGWHLRRVGPAHRVLRVLLNALQARESRRWYVRSRRARCWGSGIRSARMYATFSGTVRTADKPAATWVA